MIIFVNRYPNLKYNHNLPKSITIKRSYEELMKLDMENELTR